jgi:hypothetical protein
MLKAKVYNHTTKEVLEFIARNEKELNVCLENSTVKYTVLEKEKY